MGGSRPTTPRGLLTRLEHDFDPVKETIESYHLRVQRVMSACAFAKHDVDFDWIERLLLKAGFMQEVVGKKRLPR